MLEINLKILRKLHNLHNSDAYVAMLLFKKMGNCNKNGRGGFEEHATQYLEYISMVFE